MNDIIVFYLILRLNVAHSRDVVDYLVRRAEAIF